jgi:hypothetical protein
MVVKKKFLENCTKKEKIRNWCTDKENEYYIKEKINIKYGDDNN